MGIFSALENGIQLHNCISFMRVFKLIENSNFLDIFGDFVGTPWAIAPKLISIIWLVLSSVPVNFRDCRTFRLKVAFSVDRHFRKIQTCGFLMHLKTDLTTVFS